MSKTRLDVLLTRLGLAPSREKAQAIIMSGVVFVDNKRADKPGTTFPDGTVPEVRGATLAYVSRGGLKLEKALAVFPLDVAGKVGIDCGASTGGFTDCLLQNGAACVYAVDVGYGQLDYRLRQDDRVIVMERTNIRHVTPDQLLHGRPDVAVIDVSFISLRIVLPVVHGLLSDVGEVICLVKPQFEAGREHVGKNGVVKDPMVHEMVLERFVLQAQEAGFFVCGLDYSPIRGPEGNIEFLAHLAKERRSVVEYDIRDLVLDSHRGDAPK